MTEENNEYLKTIDSMAERWQSSIVARKAMKSFTGGLYSSAYLANCDSTNTGPAGMFLVGGSAVYPVQSVVEWLKSRATATWQRGKK